VIVPPDLVVSRGVSWCLVVSRGVSWCLVVSLVVFRGLPSPSFLV
jgi:hypothetical protein